MVSWLACLLGRTRRRKPSKDGQKIDLQDIPSFGGDGPFLPPTRSNDPALSYSILEVSSYERMLPHVAALARICGKYFG